jgi:hypothetical protein
MHVSREFNDKVDGLPKEAPKMEVNTLDVHHYTQGRLL